MKVLFINETCGKMSHGRICTDMARQLQKDGHVCKVAFGRIAEVPEECRDLAVRIGNMLSVYWHVLLTRVFDLHGFGSYFVTKNFLNWVDKYNPDMIWLHNIHGYYINVELLFRWIKTHPTVKVKWTLHDCWSFTGHCSHYMAVNCDRWKNGCHHCPEKRRYPASLLFDNSKNNYEKKKALFTGVSDMSLITPSMWLADQVKESFLKIYPTTVVNNQIDREVFRPVMGETEVGVEEFRALKEKYGIPRKKQIILGVASKWTERKGWDDFIKLNGFLQPQKQVIVLVGLNQKQMDQIPETVIGIKRTENRKELACLYSLADVFVNLTYEENYPTVNLEAEACGTDVITYDAGGCRETVSRTGSCVFPVGRLDLVAEEINNRIE